MCDLYGGQCIHVHTDTHVMCVRMEALVEPNHYCVSDLLISGNTVSLRTE